MHFFRMRLILALVVGITLVSVASTYFEVLAHKHILRQDLQRRAVQKATSLVPEIELALAGDQNAKLSAEVARLRTREAALGLGVYDAQGKLVASAGPVAVVQCAAARSGRQSHPARS